MTYRQFTRGQHPHWLMFLATLLATGCALQPVARTDHDPRADFSGYRTFAWMRDDPLITPDGRGPEVSALNMKRIMDATESELLAKGYRRVPAQAEADFVIAFTVGTRERIDVSSYPLPYHGPWIWHPVFWEHDLIARTYREGMLSIDIFDQRSRAPVWHGWMSRRITERDISDTATAIREAVTTILAEFPPP